MLGHMQLQASIETQKSQLVSQENIHNYQILCWRKCLDQFPINIYFVIEKCVSTMFENFVKMIFRLMSKNDLSLLVIGWKEGLDIWCQIILLMKHRGIISNHLIGGMEVKGIKYRRLKLKQLQIKGGKDFQGLQMQGIS